MSGITLYWPGGIHKIEGPVRGSILDAALAVNIPIANSCKRGDCQQCRAFLFETYDKNYKSGTSVNLCQVFGIENGKFELSINPFEDRISPRLLPAKVANIKKVTTNIIQLSLRIPPKQNLNFIGGQYASLILQGGLKRNYSIANFIVENNQIDFYIKYIDGGQFSNWLVNTAVLNSMLQIRAPLGNFRIRPIPTKTTWLLGTGTGIVPLISMLERNDIKDFSPLGRIKLLWGMRSPTEAFYVEKIDQLMRGLKIDFETIYSQNGETKNKRVTDILRRDYVADDVIYAAGHPDMIRDVYDICEAKGRRDNRIFSDAFSFSPREAQSEKSE